MQVFDEKSAMNTKFSECIKLRTTELFEVSNMRIKPVKLSKCKTRSAFDGHYKKSTINHVTLMFIYKSDFLLDSAPLK